MSKKRKLESNSAPADAPSAEILEPQSTTTRTTKDAPTNSFIPPEETSATSPMQSMMTSWNYKVMSPVKPTFTIVPETPPQSKRQKSTRNKAKSQPSTSSHDYVDSPEPEPSFFFEFLVILTQFKGIFHIAE
jgi:hypothetical protein